MHKIKWLTSLAIIVMLMGGCAGDSETTTDEEAVADAIEQQIEDAVNEQVEEPANARAEDFIHPCEVITEDEVRRLFKVDPQSESFKMDRSETSYPNCHYSWTGDEKRTMKIGGKDVEVDKQCVVSITIVDRPVSISMYEQSIASYPDELEQLSVGDQAVWSEQRSQITVRKGQNLFHVHVNYSNSTARNRATALQLSEKIIRYVYGG